MHSHSFTPTHPDDHRKSRIEILFKAKPLSASFRLIGNVSLSGAIMIIECPHCESKVDCDEKGEVELDIEYNGFPTKVVLLMCKVCYRPLLGMVEIVQTAYEDPEWGPASRLWPDPEAGFDWAIPEIVRNSLTEAEICFKAKAYSACAVMCGRAIEGVCKHHDSETKTLASGLKKLRESGVIDERIYGWGEALRENRNLSAHATTEKVTKGDARDLLDFSIAICNYVFILNEKFERFQKRQAKTSSDVERPDLKWEGTSYPQKRQAKTSSDVEVVTN